MRLPLPPPRLPRRPGAAPRGVATLVVVMVLFFIVALVAAYTSRNLIFEQRTSANQYRATQAFEAAEAGLEWALTMLNSGRIDASCVPQTTLPPTDDSFRLRYLAIAPDTGRITARLLPSGDPLQAACVFDPNPPTGASGTSLPPGWQCSCPDNTAPLLAAPTGNGTFPAFVLRFHDIAPDGSAYPTGVVRIESVGCTRLDSAGAICAATTASGDGRATVNAVVALKSALTTRPSAALTVRGNLSGANSLQVTNNDAASGGLTLRLGGTIMGGAPTLNGPAGSPSTPVSSNPTVVDGDTSLPSVPAPMFSLVFAAERDTYRLQPAAVHVDCPARVCAATTVHDLALLNPGRVLWADGDLDLKNIPGPIGSAASPVVLVVTGKLSISDPAVQVNGLVYVADPTLANDGGLVLGAFIAENNLSFSGGAATTNIVYDANVLDLLQHTSGSFVRVPGGWRDF